MFSVQGKSAWYCFMVFCSFVLYHLCPVRKKKKMPKLPSQPSSPHFYYMHLSYVKCRMDWSYRKPYIWLSFNFLKQYSAFGACLTSVNMQETVKFSLKCAEIPWLVKLSLTGRRINFPDMVTHVTLILCGDPKYRCSFRILNNIENRGPALINFWYAWLKRQSCYT